MGTQYRMIDLCAGIGGIRRGFELAGGFINVLSAEIDEMAVKTYRHLYDDDAKNDITALAFKNLVSKISYDVLLAGFPCQAFSSVGLRKGFEDNTKGTIFFDIAQIIKKTQPKAILLENVQNLLTHNKGQTFRTILETLENELGYSVVGVSKGENGEFFFCGKSFLRNSKDFGIPQNRPRVYIMAFSRFHFGNRIDRIPKTLPESSGFQLYSGLSDLLDENVPAQFFLAEGFLQTLENHASTQKARGYGFGCKVINAVGIEKPIANTLLATGGSGRERNLICDPKNGELYVGKLVGSKQSPINSKFIRFMTPNEWARLQGFKNFAFIDGDGVDTFSFPENTSNAQQYKQLGNSVTIPVIKEMALFMYRCLDAMS